MDVDWDKIRDWTDMLVGPALLVILVVIILEIFFPDLAHSYHTTILVADYAAISVFVVDLGFKFHRATKWKGFLRDYWLEIIAIMPGFLVFRVLDTFFVITRTAELSQDAIHLATRSERLAALAGGSELTRAARFERVMLGVARTPRLARAVDFFKPHEA
ncbi:MAG: ion transporter [Candidatus Nanohaloarchaea archaeon]